MIKSKLPVIVTQWVDLAVDFMQLSVDPHTSVTRAEAVAMLLTALDKGPKYSTHLIALNTMPELKPVALRILSRTLGVMQAEMPSMIGARIAMQISQSSMADVQAELCDI